MKKWQAVPLGRIVKYLPERGTWYAPAYQGPAGLFVIRSVEDAGLPLFQVARVYKMDQHATDVSEPFMTYEGADQFARRMAEGGSSDRFA